ncbi:IclR family transcriptional regulator [Halomarina halobia]|uniref:IclR family transcriptional regulator n=1 Tax=Halomarina halobia TaxID=3033386 RepID=A0ABD6AEN0_9EURY|nr:IclR family transcriptional regulator [Halomarina sp. PSR21]
MTERVERTGGRQVQAVQISCDILQALRELDGGGVTELATHLDVSKAAVHGHLSTLYRNEFVVKEGDTYHVSLRFVDFGEFAKNSIPIYEIAREETDALADQTGEVAQLMVEEHGRGVYLHKAVGDKAIKTRSYAGERKYLHCTALGKSILAHLPMEHVDEIVEHHGLPKQTDRTISTRDELKTELEQVRERGVSFDDEEILQGLRCVAAPVIGHDDTLYGAISVSGPTSRMKGERFTEELPELVKGAANVIQVNTTQL